MKDFTLLRKRRDEVEGEENLRSPSLVTLLRPNHHQMSYGLDVWLIKRHGMHKVNVKTELLSQKLRSSLMQQRDGLASERATQQYR